MEDPHEKIKNIQIKMSEKYVEKLPSKTKSIYWIYALNKYKQQKNSYPESTPRSGKFLIFRPFDEIDVVWGKIKESVENGLLGNEAKVSTKMARKEKKSKNHVICVYTYDKDDFDDMNRIYTNICKTIGNVEYIYKTNKQTMKE